MTERLHYSMLVQWSDDDPAYLVTLPEWEGRVFNPVTHGENYQDAVEQAHEALAALVASALQHGGSSLSPASLPPAGPDSPATIWAAHASHC